MVEVPGSAGPRTGFRKNGCSDSKFHIDFADNRILVPWAKWKKDKRKTEGNPMSSEVRALAMQLCQVDSDHLFP